MKCYHGTSSERAAMIERDGFRDAVGQFLTDREWSGVWVSDLAGVEPTEALFEVDIPDAAIRDFEWIEEGKGYREWLLPATLLNTYPRRRIEEDIDA